MPHTDFVDSAITLADVYASVFVHSLDAVFLSRPDLTVFAANAAACALIGRTEEEILALPAGSLINASSRNYENLLAERVRTGITRGETELIHADGTHIPVEISSRTFTGADGLLWNVVIARDITLRKQREDERRVAAIAFEESLEGMAVVAADTTILRVNKAFTEITGYSADEAVGKTTRLLSSGRQNSAFYEAMWEALLTRGRWQGEIWNRRKNGEIYPQWLSISSVCDEEGGTTRYISTFLDLSDRKKAEDDMVHLAFHDALTGLPNRRLLADRLHQSILSTDRGTSGAALFIDIDGFNLLNEVRGHEAGDDLLVHVARCLQDHMEADDTVARVGGDEFVVLLEDLEPDVTRAAVHAERTAHILRDVIAQPVQIRGETHVFHASIGITMFSKGEPTEQIVLQRAEAAVADAKAGGRNTVRFFNPVIQAALVERVEMETALNAAIPDQLRLHYQPQVEAHGDIRGVEALLRWEHPQRGLIPPADFISIAEEDGLIVPIGTWVLATACQQLKEWEADRRTRDLVISVNVSARQFRQPDFVDVVLASLHAADANPRRLKLELTESLLVDDIEHIGAKMQQLRSHGVSFSLDDFGTGFSSLKLLKSLPLQELKIDQSFVRDVTGDGNSSAIVRTIVALGQTLGLEVIAEGVESPAQQATLAILGCSAFQGYLFGRPMAAQAMTRWLEAHNFNE